MVPQLLDCVYIYALAGPHSRQYTLQFSISAKTSVIVSKTRQRTATLCNFSNNNVSLTSFKVFRSRVREFGTVLFNRGFAEYM